MLSYVNLTRSGTSLKNKLPMLALQDLHRLHSLPLTSACRSVSFLRYANSVIQSLCALIHLQVVDLDTPTGRQCWVDGKYEEPSLAFDPVWLGITRALHPWFSTSKLQRPFPEESEARALVSKEREWVNKNIKTNQEGEILVTDHLRFAMTAPGPAQEGANRHRQRKSLSWSQTTLVIAFLAPWYKNPQTESFCRMLGISNLIDPPTTAGHSKHV